MNIERLAVRLFILGLLVFAYRMTWEAAYLRGRESVYQDQAVAVPSENCYSYDGDCSDHKTTKPKGDHHVIQSLSK